MNYVATFFTHYDATVFARELIRGGINNTAAPVPRALSSACGTAVLYSACEGFMPKEIELCEQLAVAQEDGYIILISNK